MATILTNARDARPASSLLALDAATGLCSPAPGGTATGLHYEVGGAGISLYVSGDSVVLQVRDQRFDAQRAKTRYAHDFDAGTTTFEASDGDRTATVVYEAWWHELGLTAEDVMFEPERDEDEDFAIFLALSLQDPDYLRRFEARWTGEEPAADVR